MKTKKILGAATVLLILGMGSAHAQVGMPTSTPQKNAQLDLNGANSENTKGLLLPRVRLTATDKEAPLSGSIKSGMKVYNLASAGSGDTAVSPGEYVWNGTSWVRMAVGTVLKNILGSGEPSGSQPEGTIYIDTLKTSPTYGKQSAYDGTKWISYTAPNTTAWYASGSENDAGGDKKVDIFRYGNIGIGMKAPKSRIGIWRGESALSLDAGSVAFNREAFDGKIYDPTRSAFQIQYDDKKLDFQVYKGDGSNTSWNAMSIGDKGNVGFGMYGKDLKSAVGIARNGVYTTLHGGGIGFNREVATGDIFNKTSFSYQLQYADKRLDFQVYKGDGSIVSWNAMSIGNNGNVGFGMYGENVKSAVGIARNGVYTTFNGDGIGFNRDVATGDIFDKTNPAYQIQYNKNDLVFEVFDKNGKGLAVNPLVISSTGLVHINGTAAGKALQVADGTQGAGKVLTSDANGVATWGNTGLGAPSAAYLWEHSVTVGGPLVTDQVRVYGPYTVGKTGWYQLRSRWFYYQNQAASTDMGAGNVWLQITPSSEVAMDSGVSIFEQRISLGGQATNLGEGALLYMQGNTNYYIHEYTGSASRAAEQRFTFYFIQ